MIWTVRWGYRNSPAKEVILDLIERVEKGDTKTVEAIRAELDKHSISDHTTCIHKVRDVLKRTKSQQEDDALDGANP